MTVRRRYFQYFWLCEPHVSVRWDLDDVRFFSFVQTIKKRSVTTIKFVGRPCHNFDPVRFRTIDQVQSDLWFRLENNLLRDVCFFRRAESLAHSSGRYRRASSRQSNPGAEYANATLLMQFSIFPRLPLYCRLTPAVSRPLLAVPVSSTHPIASG